MLPLGKNSYRRRSLLPAQRRRSTPTIWNRIKFWLSWNQNLMRFG
jgi:hypothetical protein